MVELNEAIRIAETYFAKNNEHIVQINEADEFFIFFGANAKEDIKFGRSDIKINKTTAEVSRFVLPSAENFKLLKMSKQIEY